MGDDVCVPQGAGAQEHPRWWPQVTLSGAGGS